MGKEPNRTGDKKNFRQIKDSRQSPTLNTNGFVSMCASEQKTVLFNIFIPLDEVIT